MAERPGPLGRLDRLVAAATIAHEHVADLHRLAADEGSLQALRESAEILFQRMPAITSGVRACARVWAEQELLDPDRAADTLRSIESEMTVVEPELRSLLRRQSQLARRLRRQR